MAVTASGSAAAAPLRLGVDIGGTKIAAGLVDGDGAVLLSDRIPAPRTGGRDVMAAVCTLALELIRRAESLPGSPAVTGIGVGAPGVVDPAAGQVRSATDVLPGWAGTDVAGPLVSGTGLPVAVENDVRAAALGEASHGAGAGADRLLVVSLGTGVGGALVFGGILQRGGHGTAGEIAHLLAPEDGPIACGCGRYDHLESHVCGPAIAAAYLGAYLAACGSASPVVALPEVVERWRAGDRLAGRAVTSAAGLTGRAVAGFAGAVDVDAVVLTGGVVRIGEDFLAPLREAFAASVIAPLRAIPVMAGALGGDAPLIGAAGLVVPDRPHGAAQPVGAGKLADGVRGTGPLGPDGAE